MGILSRFLLRQNTFLLFLCLAFGTGVYLLSDIFDRLDDFLEAGSGISLMVFYFAAKTPLIVSQILPAVFLVAMIVQLSLMQRSRELLALSAGGISTASLIRFFLILGIAWCTIQITFSQAVGVRGEQAANTIWTEDVRKKQASVRLLRDIWFRDGNMVVHFAQASPMEKSGQDLTAYEFGADRQTVLRIIKAEEFSQHDRNWKLRDASVLDPLTFERQELDEFDLPVTQQLKNFVAIDPRTDPASLPLWQLGTIITVLKASGSNVERLETAWHMKLAYGFAIPVMALVALAVVTLGMNIYYNICLSLLVTFAYYSTFVVFVSAGQKGLVSPVAGAWMANMIFAAIAAVRLYASYAPAAFNRLMVDLPRQFLRKILPSSSK